MEEVDSAAGAGLSELERDESWTEVKSKSKMTGRDPMKLYVSKLTSQNRMSRHERSVNSIDKPGVSFAPSEINGVSASGWEKVSVQVDSGAIGTVAPKHVALMFPVRRTKAAKMGMGYVAANGTRIDNHGERLVQGYTDDGTSIAMAMQVTDVKRTLGPAYRMNKAGNRVVLDGDESYMINKSSGIVTPISLDNGKFIFNIWVKSKEETKEEAAERRSQDERKRDPRSRNAFAALAEDDSEEKPKPNKGFSWRDEIF